jgi:hypothetical protein
MTARLFGSSVPRAGQIHFDPSGEIAGLRFLPPQ